ncbi:MAG: tail protein X [Robiginitomaculum sp.]|nr:tail protein X [Robiginitomaculum sp.]
MQSIETQSGQTLDDVVYQIYGDNPHMLAELTAANPHTLNLGVHLPSGVHINLPEIKPTTKTQTIINLWD